MFHALLTVLYRLGFGFTRTRKIITVESFSWPATSMAIQVWQKLYSCNFLGGSKCAKCQTWHDFTVSRALSVHTSFSDLDLISRSQQHQTVSTENFTLFFFIQISRNFETLFDCRLHQLDHENITIFGFHIYSRELIDMFPDLTEVGTLAFYLNCITKIF